MSATLSACVSAIEEAHAATDARLDRELVPRSTMVARDKMLADKLGTMEQDIRYIKDAVSRKPLVRRRSNADQRYQREIQHAYAGDRRRCSSLRSA